MLVLCFVFQSCWVLGADLSDIRTLLYDGKIEDAIPELKQYLHDHPEDGDGRTLYGQALAWDYDYDEAQAQYQMVLKKNPNDHDALIGLARLREYQNRPQDAISLINQGLRVMPQDPEFSTERRHMESSQRALACEAPRRFTVHAGVYHEGYSFTDPGNGASLSLQDRDFYGWNAGVSTSYEHRFTLDDDDLSLNASHALAWHDAFAGFTFGGAPHGDLLPGVHASLLGGMPLTAGFSAAAEGSFRHYLNANVYALAPTLTLERWNAVMSAGYALSRTYYTAGGNTGGLSSYQAKVQDAHWCFFQPWISYAYTHEGIEEGFAGLTDFRAHHYSVGAGVWLGGGWRADGFYEYEVRPDLVQHINRWGLGFSYSWGRMGTHPS